MEDKETSLQREELDRLIISSYPGGAFSYVFGLDMGMTCWMTVAAVLPDGTLIIVKIIPIPLFEVLTKVPEIAKEYRTRMGVIDHGPYTETVYRLQQVMTNLFAGVYTSSTGKNVELLKVSDKDEDKEKGQERLRQVNIARDKGFDVLMLMMRSGNIMKVSDDRDEEWKEHITDQKRVREFRNDEIVFVWRKTSGMDHMHHSLLYCLVASRMLGVSSGSHVQLDLVHSFKVRPA